MRFAVGVVCGLVFGGTAGLKIAAELGIDELIGTGRDDADGLGGGEPLRLVGAGFRAALFARPAASAGSRQWRRSPAPVSAHKLRSDCAGCGETPTDARARPNEHKFVGLGSTRSRPDGAFSGYASLFGSVDLGKDMVERGAFAAIAARRAARRASACCSSTIRRADRRVDRDPRGCARAVRARPAGEGGRPGARGAGADARRRARRAVDRLPHGAREEATPTSGVRRILEADLWEISVVTFPMLPGARVEPVKGRQRRRAADDTDEFERWLTRDAGLTRGEARTVIAKGLRQPGCASGMPRRRQRRERAGADVMRDGDHALHQSRTRKYCSDDRQSQPVRRHGRPEDEGVGRDRI